MAEKEPSAEKQLLNLIESGQSQGGEEGGTAPGGGQATVRRQPLFSLDAIRGRIAFLKEALPGLLQGKDLSFSLDIVNNALIGTALCLAMYLGIFVMVQSSSDKHLTGLTISEMKVPEDNILLESDVHKGLLKEKIRQRDLFSPKPIKITEEVRVEQGPSVEDLLKDLRLVGISYSPATNESYVMVENIKTELTYILQEGDNIAKFVIEQVLSDKVVLRKGNESVELK